MEREKKQTKRGRQRRGINREIEILRDEDGEGEGRESLKDEVLGEMTESGAMAHNPSHHPHISPSRRTQGRIALGGGHGGQEGRCPGP